MKKDSFLLGITIGAIIPLALFAILYYLSILIGSHSPVNFVTEAYINKIELISIFLPLLLFRYITVNLKFDKAGRGIIFILFLYAIVYFFITLRS